MCSHPAPGLILPADASEDIACLAPSIAFQWTLIARAGVCRSARVWARRNRAAPPPRRVPLTGQPARATGMISSWPPSRRRSTTQSRQPGTRCARVCSPSTVEGLGHVGVELGAAAGTSGPSLTPAASPKGLSTRPTRPHDDPTKTPHSRPPPVHTIPARPNRSLKRLGCKNPFESNAAGAGLSQSQHP